MTLDLLESLPRNLIGKLERIIPPMVELSGRNDAWNIVPDLQAATRNRLRVLVLAESISGTTSKSEHV